MRELARAMVGGELPDRGKVRGGAFGPPVLEVRGLRAMSDLGVEALGGVSFSVREGEVFAIAGIAGNGQRELAEVLAAVRPATGGEFRFRGERMNGKTPRELFERGIGRIPEDRMESGAILDFPLRDDLALDCYYRPPLARRGLLIRSEVDRRARRLVKEYSIRAHSIDVETGTLSGGNLQKTILARALDRRPGLIIASLPTRGLDIGAADFIHAQLREARDAGAGVLLISEDLDEIFALADTIGVICRGELLRILRVRDADATSLGLLMCGVNGTTAQS
jgi:simple sugar transport system ATP-binding protein